MCLLPLSEEYVASFPQVWLSSWYPPVPNPILESQSLQSSLSSAMIPILAFDAFMSLHTALNPSLTQLVCKEALEPISDFHNLRPSDVLRYFPSAISECSETAVLLTKMKLVRLSIFIPRQIFSKGVFQKVGNLVSCLSKPVAPPGRL